MELLNRYIPYKYRIFILPLGILLVVVILTLTLGQYLYSQIVRTQDDLTKLSQQNASLQTKSVLLTSQDKAQVKSQAQAALAAIPDTTPSLPALASLRYLSIQRGVTVSEFRLSEKDDPKQTVKSVEIQITVYGGLLAVIGFYNDIKGYTPLMKVTDMSISMGSSSLASGRATILTAWSPLPTSLGAPEKPIDPLKEAEKQVLDKLQSLKPAGIGIVSNGVTQNSGRTDPFN